MNTRKEYWHTFCNEKRKQCKEKDGVRNEYKKFAKVNEQILDESSVFTRTPPKYSTKRSK